MRERAAFACARIVHEGETIDGERALRTVIAERPGTVDERIVVVAHRDAAGPRAEAELSATAALLELARVFGAPRQHAAHADARLDERRQRRRGRRRARSPTTLRGPFAGVLVLGDLASRNVRVPLLAPWSNRARRRRPRACAARCRRRCAWRPAAPRTAAARAEPVRALRAARDLRRAGRAAGARAAGDRAVDRRRPPAARRRRRSRASA